MGALASAGLPLALLGVAAGLLPGLPVPHPPVALDLGLACYGLALLVAHVPAPARGTAPLVSA